ncbi:MAG: LemA family protein [Clostridia bacterium]|nr:LemA family protein [Clostridia bacterium]
MKKRTKLFVILSVIALVVIILVSSVTSTYNSLVSLETEVETKQAQISTQLQRRSDLIPNLVNTVKGYAAHENEVYTAIADARSKLAGANTVEELSEADSQLSSALSRLLVVVENYPQLKASENFIALQDQLEGTENRIATARNDYNKAAKTYNTKIRKFPSNIFAGMFGFEKADYFEAEEGAEKNPEVSFE